MTKLYMKTAAVALAIPSVVAAYGCDVDQVEEGRAPSVDVDPGKLPEYDVDTPEVDVKTERKQVEVPDIDVHTETKEVEVPDIDVKMPDEDDDLDEDAVERNDPVRE